MHSEELARRWRAAVAWLRRPTGAPPRPTAWALAADTIFALLLTFGVISGALDPMRGDQRAGHVDAPDRAIQILSDGRPAKEAAPAAPDAPGIGPADAPWVGPDAPHPAPWELALVALTALPLAARRRYPLASFWVIAIAAIRVYHMGASPTWTIVASVVAAYSAPAYSRYRNLALASVVVAAALAIGVSGGEIHGLPTGLITFLLLCSVGLAANALHTWRQQARTMERDQAAATRLAVDRERARLARELHDVVSHNVSVMVIQAGAARKVVDTAPEQAKEALLAVEAGGRAAMTELRQVIGLLTVDTEGVDLAPQPGLDGLPALVARVAESGVAVQLDVAGVTEADVSPGVGLTAYRIVQEALTNAVKHAAGASVHVAVSRSDSVLRVEVTDTGGVPSAGSGSGSGRGLLGLQERLALYGGTLITGPRPTGGFRVLAHIPLGGDPAGDFGSDPVTGSREGA